MACDRFIPFTKQDIVTMCSNELASTCNSNNFTQLTELLSSLIHFQYHQKLEHLKNNYAPFNPNSDTQVLTQLSAIEKEHAQTQFAEQFASILNAANYERITNQDLNDALTEESLFKVRLEVEFEDFSEVVFYRRGESQRTESISTWWGLKKKTLHFTNYDRVAVYIRFKDQHYFNTKNKAPCGFEPSSTIIKLFQNVPKADLEMLFPNSEVKMRPIDKIIIGSSALVGGAVVLVTKLGASIVLFIALISVWLGWRNEDVEMTQKHFITFAIGMGVFGSFIFKEWSKFKNRKIRFMKALSDNLYFKNLDNNAGVFHTLVDSAEEEDVKEALLAYTFLLKSPQGLTASALDKIIEGWFKSNYQCELDFEISDALNKLNRLQLITMVDQTYHAVTIHHAKAVLDKHWDGLFNYT